MRSGDGGSERAAAGKQKSRDRKTFKRGQQEHVRLTMNVSFWARGEITELMRAAVFS